MISFGRRDRSLRPVRPWLRPGADLGAYKAAKLSSNLNLSRFPPPQHPLSFRRVARTLYGTRITCNPPDSGEKPILGLTGANQTLRQAQHRNLLRTTSAVPPYDIHRIQLFAYDRHHHSQPPSRKHISIRAKFRTTGEMLDERELQIHPIVQDSVQHNARVCELFPHLLPQQPLTVSTDHLEHPQPDRLALRRRRRHARPRVVPGLRVLPRRHPPHLRSDIHLAHEFQTGGFLLQTRKRDVDGRLVRRTKQLRADVDTGLWARPSLTMQSVTEHPLSNVCYPSPLENQIFGNADLRRTPHRWQAALFRTHGWGTTREG